MTAAPLRRSAGCEVDQEVHSGTGDSQLPDDWAGQSFYHWVRLGETGRIPAQSRLSPVACRVKDELQQIR